MAADDLTAPLGQKKRKRHSALPAMVPKIIAAALGLVMLVFAGWALVAHDPLGGEPATVVSAEPQSKAADAKGQPAEAAPQTDSKVDAKANPPAVNRYDGPAEVQPPPGSRTVNIINGISGKRQQVMIPDPDAAKRLAINPLLLETTRHGQIPKIAPDGARPFDVYASPAKAAIGKIDGPRVAPLR